MRSTRLPPSWVGLGRRERADARRAHRADRQPDAGSRRPRGPARHRRARALCRGRPPRRRAGQHAAGGQGAAPPGAAPAVPAGGTRRHGRSTSPGPAASPLEEIPGVPGAAAADGPTTAADTRRPPGCWPSGASTCWCSPAVTAPPATIVEACVGADAGLGPPVVGIPGGVKMRSGVFGQPGGRRRPGQRLPGRRRPSGARGRDPGRRRRRASTEFYALAAAPGARAGLPGPRPLRLRRLRPAELAALCAAVAADLEPGTLYLFGPGSTTAAGVLRRSGWTGPPLGVDAVLDGQLIGDDLTEQAIAR